LRRLWLQSVQSLRRLWRLQLWLLHFVGSLPLHLLDSGTFRLCRRMQLVSRAGCASLGPQPMWIHMGWCGVEKIERRPIQDPEHELHDGTLASKECTCADEVTAKVSILTS
jgi:hypothetical protein